MSGLVEKLNLYDDIVMLHDALVDVLTVFIRDHGTDHDLVAKSVAALDRHPELPLRASLALRIPSMRGQAMEAVKQAAREAGIIVE